MFALPCINWFPLTFTNRFQRERSFIERKRISTDKIKENPTLVPVIIDPYSSDDPSIQSRRCLITRDNDVQAILTEIYEQIKIHDPIIKVRVYVILPSNAPSNMKLIHAGSIVGNIYDQYHDPDGFLYIVYTVERSVIGSIMRYLNLS